MTDIALFVVQGMIIGLLAYIALTDFRNMKIWNTSIAAGVVLYLIWLGITGFASFTTDVLYGGLLFLVGLVFWLFRLFGGGDCKMMLLCGLFSGAEGIFAFAIALVPISLVIYFLLKKARELPPIWPSVTGRIVAIAETKRAPYGVVLALATMIGFLARSTG